MDWWKNDLYEKEIFTEMGLKLLSIFFINKNYALFTAKRPGGEEVTIKVILLKTFFKNPVLKNDVLLELEVHTSQGLSFINLVKYYNHKYLKNLLVIVYENFAEKAISKFFKNINKQGTICNNHSMSISVTKFIRRGVNIRVYVFGLERYPADLIPTERTETEALLHQRGQLVSDKRDHKIRRVRIPGTSAQDKLGGKGISEVQESDLQRGLLTSRVAGQQEVIS